MRRCLAFAVLVASLWAVPPGAGAQSEKAYDVVHEETTNTVHRGGSAPSRILLPVSDATGPVYGGDR